MSTERDVNRIVRSWLEEGVAALPDRVLDTVLDQLPATPQRRAWWPVRRFGEMNNFTKVRGRGCRRGVGRVRRASSAARSGQRRIRAEPVGEPRDVAESAPPSPMASPSASNVPAEFPRARCRRARNGGTVHRHGSEACATCLLSPDAPKRTPTTPFASRSPSPTAGREWIRRSGWRRTCRQRCGPGLRARRLAVERSVQIHRRTSRSGRPLPTSSTRSRSIPSSTRRRPSTSRLPGTPGSTSTFRFRRTSQLRTDRPGPRLPAMGTRHLRPGPGPSLAPVGPRRRWRSRRRPEHGLRGDLGTASHRTPGDRGLHPDRTLTRRRVGRLPLDPARRPARQPDLTSGA